MATRNCFVVSVATTQFLPTLPSRAFVVVSKALFTSFASIKKPLRRGYVSIGMEGTSSETVNTVKICSNTVRRAKFDSGVIARFFLLGILRKLSQPKPSEKSSNTDYALQYSTPGHRNSLVMRCARLRPASARVSCPLSECRLDTLARVAELAAQFRWEVQKSKCPSGLTSSCIGMVCAKSRRCMPQKQAVAYLYLFLTTRRLPFPLFSSIVALSAPPRDKKQIRNCIRASELADKPSVLS